MLVKRKCLSCGIYFEKRISANRVNEGKGIFCSSRCCGNYQDSKVLRKCLICGKEFKVVKSHIENGGGKYCSNQCRWKSSIGKVFRKGYHHSASTIEKIRLKHLGKTISVEQRIKQSLSMKGKNSGIMHGLWKGNNAGYGTLHIWVKNHKGLPIKCEHCGKIGKKHKRNWNIQWANVDHKYRRNLGDYIGLCISCHRKYDIKNNNFILNLNSI